MVVVTLLFEAEEEVLSWVPGTSDQLLQTTAVSLLGLEPGSPVFVMDDAIPSEAASKRDALLLSNGLAHGSRVRVYSKETRARLPAHRPLSCGTGAVLGLVKFATPIGHGQRQLGTAEQQQQQQRPRGPSFLTAHIKSLSVADSASVPRLQCCLHVLALREVDPRTESFTAVLNIMIDWQDAQLAGREKDEIDDIINDDTMYLRPTISIANMVGGGEELQQLVPRCDNSKTGNIKYTAKITGTLASAMDVHRFPFDAQALYIETQVRSITLDKKNLLGSSRANRGGLQSGQALAQAGADKAGFTARHGQSLGTSKGGQGDGIGQGGGRGGAAEGGGAAHEGGGGAAGGLLSPSSAKAAKANARLWIQLVDPSSRGPVVKARHHSMRSDADKVHEWNFCTSQDAMRYLVTEEWRGAQAEHARLLAAGRRARTPLKRRELLEQQAAVLRRLSKHMPKPQLKYAPLLSNAAEGKHVVMFEIARLVGSTVWTLVLPIFLVTCISFAQFGVDPTALHDRLSVTLTCILTIISFQVVVREKVPEVPYRTTLDEFILTSLGIMTLQVLSSTAVMGIGHRYWGTTIAGVPACPMVAPSGASALLHEHGHAWWSSAAGAVAKVENATAAGGACETAAETTTRAQLVDRTFLVLCLVTYVSSTLRFAYFAFAWRRHVAWFSDHVSDDLLTVSRQIHHYDARDALLVKRASVSARVAASGRSKGIAKVGNDKPSGQQLAASGGGAGAASGVRKRQVAPHDSMADLRAPTASLEQQQQQQQQQQHQLLQQQHAGEGGKGGGGEAGLLESQSHPRLAPVRLDPFEI